MRWDDRRRRHRSGWDMSVLRDGTAVLVAVWILLVIVLTAGPR